MSQIDLILLLLPAILHAINAFKLKPYTMLVLHILKFISSLILLFVKYNMLLII